MHEHRCLSRALEYFTSCDQVVLPNLAGIEVLVRRRSLIEHAHAGRPEAPSYEGSEYLLGFRDNADGSIVDPAAVRYASERMGQDAKIEEQRRKRPPVPPAGRAGNKWEMGGGAAAQSE